MLTKYFATFIFTFFVTSYSVSQSTGKLASVNENGEIIVSILESNNLSNISLRNEYNQLDNFPFISLAHPNFKNFRNVSIEDINNDGAMEIIFCLNETLYALDSNGNIKWAFDLDGTANFPPAIADIDNDGDFEIAVQTYDVPSKGNVYLFNHEGILQDGWPLNINNHFFLNGITIADLNGDGFKEIIASERINSTNGRVHALDISGTNFNANWPVTLNGTPAFTPSVGDINNDGSPDVITASTTALYAFNNEGSLLSGFPKIEPGAKFSYQSPLLSDLNEDENLEIIGARHGDLPGTYVIDANGDYFENWPDYDEIWTFAPPSVADIDNNGSFEIFFGRPFFSDLFNDAILLGYDNNGNDLDGFPIEGPAGFEGLVSIADIDNDGDFEIITSSNTQFGGKGFIHAYHFENREEVENFPLLVEGFTFLNGAYLSDVNNDGMLDLTALSYQTKFDASSPDSAFINVFDLEVPYDPERILFNGYKGSNDHTGLIIRNTSSTHDLSESNELFVRPNPVTNYITLPENNSQGSTYSIFDTSGKKINSAKLFSDRIDVSNLLPGLYFISINYQSEILSGYFIKI